MLQRLSCRWTMYSLVAGDSDVGGAANSGDAVGGLKEAGEAGGVTAAFLQPDPQHGHGAVGEGHGPLFAALAEATNVGAGVEVDVAAVEPGELGHPEPGLGGEREQGAVASSFPAAGVGRVEQRVDLGGGEEGHDGLVEAFLGDGQHSGDDLGVLGVAQGGVTEQGPHRGESGCGSVRRCRGGFRGDRGTRRPSGRRGHRCRACWGSCQCVR